MHSSFPPLPGSGAPPRGIFIDRWGTLLELPRQGFLSRFERTEFIPGAIDALFHAGQAGWNLYLIGNEEAVAFGRLSEEKWNALEHDLLAHLRANGIRIKRNYASIDHPQGVPPHDKDSVFHLPNTGALYHAAQVDGIVLRQSWVIGDGSLELVAGWRASCRLAGVRTGEGLRDGLLQVDPEILANDLAEALREVTSGEHVPRR